MAQITNCLKLISRMPESDQDALVSRLDELQALGVPAQRAQVQAAIDLMARLEREANPQGIRRSAARDVTDTPEFKRWFGASKVVDADGRPMVVYHGTRSDLQEFDRRSIGSATDEGFLGDGFYFTDSPRAASAYAKGEGGNVVAAYVSIKNPYYAEGLLPDSMTAESLQASGFDGVIYQTDGSGDYSEFVAFRPEQIKSATGNSGTFDPNDANITRSATRTPAGVEIVEVEDGFDAMKDGKRIGRLRDNLPRGAAEQLDESASVDIVKVENEFKGQGVGAALYDAFYEKHGGRITPSGKTSPEAWALWKRKFPQKVQEFVQAEAQRIRDGADPFMVMRSITDKDVARDVAIAAGDNVIRSVARNVAESPEFKRWFGDSKVVDADANPLVVYHGSRYNADIKRFSAAKSEQSAAERGIYFTDSADHADQYASQWGDAGPEDGGSIYPVYLKIENPYVSNAWEWNMGTDITPAQARKQGHDGYVIQNHEGGTTYIAFRPEQIKSAIGNRGTFDPSDADITRSAARPEFFSQLQRSIEQVPDRLATMSAPQWKLWLDANAAKLGVKKDEIEWSGVKDYLTLRGKDKVTRDELVAYLSDGGVRVQEVVLGNQNDRQKLSNEYDRAVAASDAAGGAMNPTYIDSLAPGDRKPEEQALLDAWNRVNENPDESWLPEAGNPKYGQYTVPGGERYREVLITLPSVGDEDGPAVRRLRSAKTKEEYNAARNEIDKARAQQYKSSHWDQPNILAHLRVDDRTDADGNKVLFIGELQSDWGQQAKKDGIRSSYKAEDVKSIQAGDPAAAQPDVFWYFQVPGNVLQIPKSKHATEAAAREYIIREKPVNPSGVPAAPFISDTKSWVSLALKRAIMMAVEDGHDRVAFITGQQAADLYDLSKQVEAIEWTRRKDGTYDISAFPSGGGEAINKDRLSIDAVSDFIGKELADRISKDPGEALPLDWAESTGLLKGIDLKVGGEGMRAFYDQIIPQVTRDVLKRLGGGQLGEVELVQADEAAVSWRKNWPDAPLKTLPQPGFDITTAMREKVMAGVPLFSRRRGWDAFPDAIIATPPSTQSSDPAYAAAKGGDMKAALELVDRVMPEDIEQRVRATIGDARPIVAAVHAEEAAGRNKIPLATAFVLGERMGLQVDEKLVQASRAKRTGSDGMARLGVQPEFSGEVERGADYLLVDDTLAQGGTLAQLKTHIEDGGGRVVGVFALSGKQYSAKISLDNATLNDVRAKYGSIEGWWKGELGYGFEGLTQSEARYMLNSRLSPEALRDRVAAARQAAGAGDGAQRSASVGDQEVARSMPRVPGLNAGPVESTTGDYGREYTPQQLAMFKNTGRTTQKPSLVERLKEARKDLGKKMAQGIVDQFRPLRDLGGNAYTLARLSKGAAGAFEALLGHGKLKIVDGAYDADTSGGFIDTVGKPLGREIEDFMWWVAANRADSLSLQDRENLFTDDDIAAGKSLADGDLEFDYLLQSGATTRDRKAAYEDSLNKFNAFGKNVLDIAEESGLIDGESRKLWESEFYVPFYRVSEEDGSFIGAKIKGGLARQRAFHELKGGSQKLNSDLLANTMRNWAHLIDASAKNRAAKATLESAQNVGIALEADAETVRQLGKSMGGKGGTVWFMDGGQQRHFLVGDPYVLEAINSLEYAGLRGPLMDALSTMKHWLTVGVTASPAFKIRNLIRDSIQAISLSGLSYNPVTNLVEGYKATDRASQDYVSTLASGGLIRFGSMLEDSASERVRRLVKKGVDGNTILDSESKVQAFYGKYLEPAIEAYQEIGNRGEEINRASLYKQLRAKGVSHAEASLMARDLMDFSMQGTWTSVRFLTQVVPFMNARLQGMYKLGRGAMEDPRRFAIVTGAVALTSISLLAAYGDDDDWKKREDWDRDGFWWFKFGGTAFRIPKPFEIGAIGSLAERGVELFTNDEFTAKRFGSRVLHLMGDNLAMNPIPQAVKPLLDIYANKDSFSGRPIESMGMERLQSEYRYNVHTSMIARGASSALNAATRTVGAEALSPVQIDSLIRGYFGWLGTFVVAGADMAVRPLTDEPTRPQADYLKVVSQGFLKTLPEPGSKYVSAMYDQAKVIEQAYATHRQMIKEGKVDEAREFAAENKDLLERYRRIEGVKEAQSKINKRVREIELSDMDPARKAEEIQKLRDQSDKIARKVY